ncbi:MAG: DUF4384 domain-containing protein [Sulfitobacter sp.]
MRSGIGIWTLGLTASAVLHIGAGAGLLAALQPEPIADQPVPESRLQVDAQEVTRSAAKEQAAQSENAEVEEPKGTALDAGAVAQSKAAPLPPNVPPTQATDPKSVTHNAAALAPQSIEARVSLPVAESANAANPQVQPATAAALPADQAASVTPSAVPLAQTLAMAEPIAQTDPSTARDSVPSVIPAALPLTQTSAPSVPISQREPDVTSSKAVLAFPASGSVDPTSLAAFQSFTQPGSTAGAQVRDDLASALSLPCARMQVTFDPDTTTLQLTGHVPDASQRAPVLAALQAQMGSDIAVAENLLILPSPQCGALSGIADVGLPQSTDQITNPLIVGADTHARAFRYTAGEALVMNLTAPDYAAFVYVDYFDADGNVIHLTPNDRSPLKLTDAKSALQIGAKNAEETGLFVTIGPPYGQEIAAAFAASVPLYSGLRPLVEPAEPYLAWLKTRVAEAREADPDFKGEWVYFFVTTAAR